jgi:N-acetylated-alpha-linked acidic dipeptidase
MLAALAGPAAPKEFQGGLPFTYHVGPGPTEARLNLDIRYHQAPVRDVITEIRGTRHPEQKVIVGGHLDAWVYGSNDNTSGWSAVMQIGRGLGRMLRQGWRPDRTIVLAGWDGEEYGLLGSTEWGEQRIRDLRRNAVAYINMDAVAGKQFYTGAVPALDNVITAATKTVRLGSGSVYDSWTKGGKQKATVDRLGSGSDYTVLLDHIGVPALDLGFSTDSGEYHSTIDDTFQLEHFLDPGYRHSAIAARLSGVAALRLANADVPWLRYSTYATAVQGYVRDLQKIQRTTPGAAQVPLGALITQAQRWQRATAALERHARRLLGTSSATTRRGQRRLAAITRTLLRQERLLTVARGLSSRPWFKHQIYAPGILTGYAAQYLPGLEDPVKAGDTATVTRYRDLLLGSLQRATAEARRAATS